MFAAALGLVGCLKNVPQDDASGKDARYKGAKKIELEGDEGRVRDVVTYPGSDRVDWKYFEIPAGKQGDVRIRLSWRPARRGMDLSFYVYDEYFERLEHAKPARGEKRSKTTTLKGLRPGKYYVQVYASTRMDAGRYTLRVRWRERAAPNVPSAEELADQIADPPILAAVIEPKEKTPEELAAEEQQRVAQEEEARRLAEERQVEDSRLADLRKPVYARVRRTQQASSGGVIITINAGRDKGVDKSWEGTLLSGNSRNPLADGGFKVIRVTARACVGKVQLSMDQVKANPRVELRRSAVE